MGYTQALQNLLSISAQAFAEIPEFGEVKDSILTILEPASRTKSKEQAWLLELCKSLGLSKQQSEELHRPFPRFLPKKSLKRGGEAFLIVAYDRWRNDQEVLLKVPLPRFTFEKTQERKISEETEKSHEPEKPVIAKGFAAVLAVAKDMCRPSKVNRCSSKQKAEPLYEQRKDRFDDTYSFARFKRSFLLQKQLHNLARREGGDLGYIPDVFEYTEPPQCFYSMEFIDAIDFLEFIRTHSDEENFEMFLKLVNFIEKILHGYGVAHCDIAPRNVLVRNGLPILLDFGIAKAQNLQEITAPGQQMGSVLMSSPGQLSDGRHRGYQDDIFSLGRLLWILLCRRIPSTDYIVAREVEGKIECDWEAVSALFDLTALPTKFRTIYKSTQDFEYEDISAFRQTLEALLCLKPQQTPCLVKCQYLVNLENKLEEIGKILEGIQKPKLIRLEPPIRYQQKNGVEKNK